MTSYRRNDIALRTKLQSIEERLCSISQGNPAPSLDSSIKTPTSFTASHVKIQRPRRRVTSLRLQPRGVQGGSPAKASCTPAPPKSREYTLLASGATRSENQYGNSISHSYPKISIYELPDQTYLLDSGNCALDQILTPALFLRKTLLASLHRMCSDKALVVSEAQVRHFQMLFDFLVASAHTASAETLMEPYNTTLTRARNYRSTKCVTPDTETRFPRLGTKPSRNLSELATISLEEKTIRLDAKVGFIRGRILSGRSLTDSTTFAFAFEYLGNERLESSPFTVYYLSHELQKGPMRSYGMRWSHMALTTSVRKFLPGMYPAPFDAGGVVQFVGHTVSRWWGDERTNHLTSGSMLPRYSVRFYEYFPKPRHC